MPLVISLIQRRFAVRSPFLFDEHGGGARITLGFPVTMGDWDGDEWVEHDFRLRDLILEQAKGNGEHEDRTTREAIKAMRGDLDEAEAALPSSQP